MIKIMQLDEVMRFGIKSQPIENNKSIVFPLIDGSFLKLYKEEYLKLNRCLGISIEDKLIDSFSRDLPNEIKKPKILIYDGFDFVGEITDGAKDISYTEWSEKIMPSMEDTLSTHIKIYSKLEEILKSTPDIVYPDICSYDNIFVSHDGNRVELIDYEGFQVSQYPTLSFSSGLGFKENYYTSSKYCLGLVGDNSAPLYSKELDIRSLIYFFYRTVFNIDLRLVGDGLVKLDDIIWATNLDDSDIMHKVWKIFQDSEKNEWLGNDLNKLVDSYYLDKETKRLVKRR